MEYINDINVIDAVIHVLENDGTNPILNEDNLILDDNTYKFVFNHLKKTLSDDSLKYANFSSHDEAREIEEVTDKFFDGKISLSNMSKSFAERLYELMRKNNTIPSADLLVANISTDIGQMIGILKLDFVKTYSNKIEDANVIIEEADGLPLNGKIQKALFIRPSRKENEFKLLILDKRTKSDDDYMPNYFLNDYCHAVVFENERDVTKRFVDIANKWVSDNEEDTFKEIELKTKIKDALINEKSIYVPNLVEDLEIENSEELVQVLEEAGIDEFEQDKEWVTKKLTKTSVAADNIKITLPFEDYNDSSQFEIKKNNDGSFSIFIKNIRDLKIK